MFAKLRRFLADDNGYLVAQDWMMVATVLMLGSALALLSLHRSLEESAGAPLRESKPPIHQPVKDQNIARTTPRS